MFCLAHAFLSYSLDRRRPERHRLVALSLTVLFYFPLDGSSDLRKIILFVSGNFSINSILSNFTFHCPAGYSHQEVIFMRSHFAYFALYINIATHSFLTFTRSVTMKNSNVCVVIYVIVSSVASVAIDASVAVAASVATVVVFLASFPPHI